MGLAELLAAQNALNLIFHNSKLYIFLEILRNNFITVIIARIADLVQTYIVIRTGMANNVRFF